LADVFYGFDLDMREIQVLRDGNSLLLSLGRLDRMHRPVVLDIGPVLHVDDLAASKVAALISRHHRTRNLEGTAGPPPRPQHLTASHSFSARGLAACRSPCMSRSTLRSPRRPGSTQRENNGKHDLRYVAD
jgi:hypothetical protein